MGKTAKIILNITIFLLIGAFVWYMAASVNKKELAYAESSLEEENAFVSPYEKLSELTFPVNIDHFECVGETLFFVSGANVYGYNIKGEMVISFAVKPKVRDIAIEEEMIYVLYPTFVEVYALNGEIVRSWEACSNLSDYCSLAIAGDFVFVTDASNKNMCKYTKEGGFVTFIKSPMGFIIPSYAFDIVTRNDTIFCSNSGRHLIESYTLNGDFIAAFGGQGSEAGFFTGCCNPSFITFTPQGKLLTSEKGTPRISSFDRNGSHREVLLNSRLLGGGVKAYEIKCVENRLYVAGKNKISVFKPKNSLAEN